MDTREFDRHDGSCDWFPHAMEHLQTILDDRIEAYWNAAYRWRRNPAQASLDDNWYNVVLELCGKILHWLLAEPDDR